MVINLQLKNSSLIFSIYDKNSKDKRILGILAEIFKEFWLELDYPHQTVPVDIYKVRINNELRADQKKIYILMQDESGNSIGIAVLYINIGETNREACFTNFYIKPEYRRLGYFKELFLESTKHIPEYVKIYKVFFRVDHNQKFPSEMLSLDKKLQELDYKLGVKLAFVNRRSEADLTEHNLNIVSEKARQLKEKAKDNGYSIYFMDNVEDFTHVPFTRQQYVNLEESLVNDMPRDQSTLEDITLSEEDFLKWYKTAEEEKMTYWIYVAVDKTDLPVAMTETRIWSDVPELSYVNDTGVHQAHRGKKLGLTLKYLMLEKLLTDSLSKDKVKKWITFNAKSNSYMIAINDELGYVESSIEHMYELPIANVVKYFSKK